MIWPETLGNWILGILIIGGLIAMYIYAWFSS